MKRFRMWFGWISLLGVLAGVACGDVQQEYRQLERDIPSLYLINGLSLSRPQYDQLAVALEKMNKLNKDCADDLKALEKRYSSSVEKFYDQQVDDLRRRLKGKKARKYPRDRGLKRAQKEGNELMVHFRKERQEQASDFYDNLTDAQRETIQLFKPCFIPAEDFKTPGRAGKRSAATGPGAKWMDRLRRSDVGGVEEVREQVLEKAVPYVMRQRKIKFSSDAKQRVYDELARNIDVALPRIRTLSEADYELEKKSLVNTIFDVPLARGDASPASEDEVARAKVESYVLNPGCLDIVRSRGSASRRSKGRSSVKAPDFHPEAVRNVMKRQHVINLLVMLHLTESQAEQLLIISKGGNRKSEDIDAQTEVMMRKGIPALKMLRTALASRKESATTEKQANQVYVAVKKSATRSFYTALHPYERKLDDLLSVHQVNVLEQGLKQKENRTYGEGEEEMRADAQRLLSKMRVMEEYDYRRKRIQMVDDFVREQLKVSQDDINVKNERTRVLKEIAKMRAMSREQYNANREVLVTQLCVRHEDGRDVQYGHAGAPILQIAPTTRLLFSDEAVQVLDEVTR